MSSWIEGTTWDSQSMGPEAYWHWWSDYVIHRIHMRVLEHIRVEAEGVRGRARDSARAEPRAQAEGARISARTH